MQAGNAQFGAKLATEESIIPARLSEIERKLADFNVLATQFENVVGRLMNPRPTPVVGESTPSLPPSTTVEGRLNSLSRQMDLLHMSLQSAANALSEAV